MAASRFPALGYSLLIFAAVALAYSNSLKGPFVLDDASSIVTNPTVRHLWPLSQPLSPPRHGGLTVEARPVLNLSLALNYALNGVAVRGYHLVNLLIHAGCALLLFGILRRTFGGDLLAFAAALFWALHPLDTAAVTYVIQRAESLMALFYLLTLYGFIRFSERKSWPWAVASVASCALGMATKEVMISAPLVILLYDRTFVTKSFRNALAARPGYYFGLMLTWLIVLILAWQSDGRGGTSGFASGVTAWRYWITQPPAILHYLRLVAWPSPQVFDYGTPWIDHPGETLPALLVLALLLGLTVRWVKRGSPVGFAFAFFFLILAPTSLVPGNRQLLAEHRMYLALAGLTFLAACLIYETGPLVRRSALVLVGFALALGGLTYARNGDYATAVALYGRDVVATPNNPFAWEDDATALLEAHRYAEARRAAERALQIDPRRAAAEDDLGSALLHLGQPAQAEPHFQKAIDLDPNFLAPRINQTAALVALGRPEQAVSLARADVDRIPNSALVHGSLASALAMVGDRDDAQREFETAIRLDPTEGETRLNYGTMLSDAGRPAEALAVLEEAVRLIPDDPEARYDLAIAYTRNHQDPLAEVEYREAIRLAPNYADARENLGGVFLREGAIGAAISEYRRAISLKPDRAAYHYNLANALLQINGRGEAQFELRRSLELDPTLRAAKTLLTRLSATPE